MVCEQRCIVERLGLGIELLKRGLGCDRSTHRRRQTDAAGTGGGLPGATVWNFQTALQCVALRTRIEDDLAAKLTRRSSGCRSRKRGSAFHGGRELAPSANDVRLGSTLIGQAEHATYIAQG